MEREGLARRSVFSSRICSISYLHFHSLYIHFFDTHIYSRYLIYNVGTHNPQLNLVFIGRYARATANHPSMYISILKCYFLYLYK